MIKKIGLLSLLVLILALAFACHTGNSKDELTLGKYVTEDGLRWVILSKNNEFEFNRFIATSYLPKGSYSIRESELILKVSDEEEYRFTINNNQIIFQSGELAEPLVDIGTVFHLSVQE